MKKHPTMSEVLRWCRLPEVALEEQAAVTEIGGTSQAACDLPVLLHDLYHLPHGCGEAEEEEGAEGEEKEVKEEEAEGE